MKRRGAGEGSIYQQPDGLWCAIVSVGRDPKTGKRRRKKLRRKSKPALLKELARLLVDPRAALPQPAVQKKTLGTYLAGWLDDEVKPSRRPTTVRIYDDAIRLHIKPSLGEHDLRDLSPALVQTWIGDMKRRGVGGRAMQIAVQTLRLALDRAVELGLLDRNPAKAARAPKAAKKEVQFHTAAEVAMVLATARAAFPAFVLAFYVLAYHSGARTGELFGLQWSDLDLKKGRWSVRHNLVEIAGELELTDTPKTATGVRVIALSKACVAALKTHRQAMLAAGHDVVSGYVFLSPSAWEPRKPGKPPPEATPIRRSNFLRRVHDPLLAAADKASREAGGDGVRRIPPHGLRHTMATLMLSRGEFPRVVQQRLGHTTVAITLQLYGHVMPGHQDEAAERLDVQLAEAGGATGGAILPESSRKAADGHGRKNSIPRRETDGEG
jgi:integrase